MFAGSGEGKGGTRATGRRGGVGFLNWKSHEGGEGLQERGEGARGPGGCLQNLGGGRAKFFFSGPRFPPSNRVQTKGAMQQHATLRRVLRRFSNSKCKT